jgi:hypothetical protein
MLPHDDLGYPARLEQPARRLVSLVTSLTESVTVTRWRTKGRKQAHVTELYHWWP